MIGTKSKSLLFMPYLLRVGVFVLFWMAIFFPPLFFFFTDGEKNDAFFSIVMGGSACMLAGFFSNLFVMYWNGNKMPLSRRASQVVNNIDMSYPSPFLDYYVLFVEGRIKFRWLGDCIPVRYREIVGFISPGDALICAGGIISLITFTIFLLSVVF